MTHKFEEYPELAEMMQEYASFGRFGDWQKFTDALNNALIKAENSPTTSDVGQSEQYCQCKCGNTVQIECDDCKDDRIRSQYV